LGLTLSWTFSYFLTHNAQFRSLTYLFFIILSCLLKIIIVFYKIYIN
jgi:hypothetical protein